MIQHSCSASVQWPRLADFRMYSLGDSPDGEIQSPRYYMKLNNIHITLKTMDTYEPEAQSLLRELSFSPE